MALGGMLYVKNFNFKNPKWQTAAVLKIQKKSRYLVMMQDGVTQASQAHRPSFILDF